MLTVPDKTIAFYSIKPINGLKEFKDDISKFLKPLSDSHERDWFTPHFYKCLPLSIGNMQGFAFSVPYTFSVMWNGGNSVDDVKVICENDGNIDKEMHHVRVGSLFGSGIVTIDFPLILRTPPGVNLMTISPPNFPLPGLSPMVGVVESDNLNFPFSLNLKVDLVNLAIRIPKGHPIMGIIPIPRYFCDSFKMLSAYDIFPKEKIEEQRLLADEYMSKRQKQTDKSNLLYYRGKDINNNKFKDHQLPRKQK